VSHDPQAPDASTALRQELSGLPTEDVLALCYRFRTHGERLRFYLDVLRHLGGRKAALAATLVCFDLASQGQQTAQREFEALAATLRDVELNPDMVRQLVQGSPYLEELWPRCQAALRGMDPRTSASDALAVHDADIVELELFSADELGDFEDLIVESVDAEAMSRRYLDLLDRFFETVPDRRQQPGTRGFFARTSADVERVEDFLRELDSLREYVPAARGMLALGELFLASHLRVRSFWGKPNPRRAELVELGLRHFVEADESIFPSAGFFGGHDAEDQAWEKVQQLLLDYFGWRVQQGPRELCASIQAYAAEAKVLPSLRFGERRFGAR
jgi:hypothetical protein